MKRRLYDDVRWRKTRAAFLRANPLCRMCAARGIVMGATVVDHVVPHGGDTGLFWDQDNWASLCAGCHSSRKQMLERAADAGKVGPHGSWGGRQETLDASRLTGDAVSESFSLTSEGALPWA